MNDRIIGEIQAETSSICITEIARISWDDGEIRIINNNEGITIDDEEYTPCGFSFNAPTEGRDGELTVDDTDGSLTYILQQKDRIRATITIIDTDEPESPLEGPVDFDVDSFTTASEGSCKMSLSSRSKLSYGLSKLTYSTAIFPGLFG